MIPNLPAYALSAALLASVAFGAVQCSQKQSARTDAAKARSEQAEYEASVAKANAAFEAQARQQEQRHAADIQRISRDYELDKAAAVEAADRVARDLRAGNLRLQDRWQSCTAASMPKAATGTGSPDARADDRDASAGRIVSAAAECDAQVRALQEVVRIDRQ